MGDKQKVYDDLTLIILKQKYPHVQYFGGKNEPL
jgi:hypothetical protein